MLTHRIRLLRAAEAKRRQFDYENSETAKIKKEAFAQLRKEVAQGQAAGARLRLAKEYKRMKEKLEECETDFLASLYYSALKNVDRERVLRILHGRGLR